MRDGVTRRLGVLLSTQLMNMIPGVDRCELQLEDA